MERSRGPPRDRSVDAIATARIVDGKIQETWNSWDELGLLQQLGVVQPARPEPENYTWDAPSDIVGDAGDPALNELLVLRVKAQFWNGKDIARPAWAAPQTSRQTTATAPIRFLSILLTHLQN